MSDQRPPVSADVADLRERMTRIETTVTGVYDILREHVVERKENSILLDAERKRAAGQVHAELAEAAAKTNAALSDVNGKLSGVDVRLASVEQDLRDFRLGWKVLATASAVLASVAGMAGAFAAKWFGWRY